MNKLVAFLLGLTPLATFVSFAYTAGELEASASAWAMDNVVLLFLFAAVGALVFGALATMASAMDALLRQEALARGETPLSTWQRLYRQLHRPVPMAKEHDALLDHDYDGIQELDNSLPPWWLYTFYGTIAFGVVYMGFFVADLMPSSEEAWAVEMATAEEEVALFLSTQANLVDETTAELLTDAAALARGEETFVSYCAACHANDGGGGVGPNLTDDYWLHGDGGIKPVFATVKHGVPEKGMIAWKNQLSAAQIHEVSSYILTLRGTTPAEPKDPQGELVPAGALSLR